jgi:nucleoside 2-deoxyribosyltransferase
MPGKPKVYLAGPEVFLPDALEIGRKKKALCARYGFEGLYPFDNNGALDWQAPEVDRRIYRANLAMMTAADMGIFNLTPFRGPSADAGTVFELGVLVGQGKPVFGYTNVADDLLARTRDHLARLGQAAVADAVAGRTVWRDAAGMTIEAFGNADNLMIDAALAGQGHPVHRHGAAAAERYSDLTGLEACLRAATAQ